eukprot:TRINITY_DN1719_c0_g1_i1.p1 TRINITY_DN1719_c0_g1~~TRINITY_DN1719_c0_g1_i1.p1  ORF type:complete len:543 (-),score=118.76 TRINITY_DN1719_c0_g1_i1:85-1713(-)
MVKLNQLSAYSIDAIVKGISNDDFSGIKAILNRLSDPELEILADFLVEIYDNRESMAPLMNFSTQLCLEQSTNEQDMVTIFASGFTTLLNRRLVFGDLGLRYFKSFVVPYYETIQLEADSINIESEKGKQRICSIVGTIIEKYSASADDVPVYIRQALLSIHQVMGKGEKLDFCVGMCMGIIGEHFISKDSIVGFFKDPSEKVSQLMKECGKLWTAVAFQIPQENEIYSQFITKYVSQLNEFISEVYDEETLQVVVKIVSSHTQYDESKEMRSMHRFKDFLFSLEDSSTISGSSDVEMSYDDQEALLEILEKDKWKISDVKNGITFYTRNNEDKNNTICVRLDGRVQAKLKDAASYFQQNAFVSKHFTNLKIEPISENFTQISATHNYPFPCSNRYININSWTWTGENEAYCLFTERAGKTPNGLVRSRVNLCGAHIKSSQHPYFLDVSLVIHIEPNGNIPNWVMEKIQKPIVMRMEKLFDAMESPRLSVKNRSQSSGNFATLSPYNGLPRKVLSGDIHKARHKWEGERENGLGDDLRQKFK